jgi:adenosylmethionine-8-amino-7-oxononanoate aminotransferase
MNNQLVQRDLDVLWHPCTQMSEYAVFPPVEIIRADGPYLYGADGKSYIDGVSSWWCKAFGHRHPAIQAALTNQMEQLEQIILANTVQEKQVQLCERLLAAANGYESQHWAPGAATGRLPGWFGKVFLADNGSTGMEVAIKMALQAQMQRGQPQRTVIAGLAGGYHGETIATLAVGDVGLYGDAYRPLFFESPNLENLPLRDGPEDPLWQDAEHEWPTIEAQLHTLAPDLAAVCYEPVLQGAGGMRIYSPDLLRRLRQWADAHGVYLIADEIAAGCGRCGAFLASHLAAANPWHAFPDAAKILPDIAVVSKGITGGTLPLSAALVRDEMYDLFLGEPHDTRRGFLHSNTYAGNGLACAVANTCLDLFAAPRFFDELREKTQMLHQLVQAEAAQRPECIHNVRSIGMLVAFDVSQPDGSDYPPEQRHGRKIFRAALDRGAWLRNLGTTVYIMPPLNTASQVLEELVTIAFASVDVAAAEA